MDNEARSNRFLVEEKPSLAIGGAIAAYMCYNVLVSKYAEEKR